MIFVVIRDRGIGQTLCSFEHVSSIKVLFHEIRLNDIAGGWYLAGPVASYLHHTVLTQVILLGNG